MKHQVHAGRGAAGRCIVRVVGTIGGSRGWFLGLSIIQIDLWWALSQEKDREDYRKRFDDDGAHELSSPEVAPLGIADTTAASAPQAVVQAPPVTPAATPKRKSAVKQEAATPPKTQPSTPMVIETSPISVRLRRSRRIIPLSTRVTPEFDQLLRETAASEGVQFIDVLERALAAYVGSSE